MANRVSKIYTLAVVSSPGLSATDVCSGWRVYVKSLNTTGKQSINDATTSLLWYYYATSWVQRSSHLKTECDMCVFCEMHYNCLYDACRANAPVKCIEFTSNSLFKTRFFLFSFTEINSFGFHSLWI